MWQVRPGQHQIARFELANEIADGRLVRLPFSTLGTEGPVGLMRRATDRETPEMRMLARAAEAAVARLGLS